MKKYDLKLVYSIFIYFPKRKHSKNHEKCFLFHLKSCFRSRDFRFLKIVFPSALQFPDSKGHMKLE